LVGEKGIIDLFRAFSALAEEMEGVKLLYVGDVLESDRDKRSKELLRREVEAAGLTDRVVFLGFRDDVPKILRAMDIFVLPSYREGLPVSVMEAMAAGLPVIASDIRGCREEVIDGVTGILVPPGDVIALREAMERLLKDTGMAEEMGRKGRERVEEEYDLAAAVERQLAVYRRIAAEWERSV